MAEIRLDDVSHSYGGSSRGDFAVRDISIAWRDGAAHALLGPSGCGKTTLLNIISGLIRPGRGRVLFAGNDVTARQPVARNIAQVFQFPVVYDTMTIGQNLAFPLHNRRVPPERIAGRVSHIAELLGLAARLAHRAGALPPEVKQLVSLGRGLVREDTAAVLFDEPLTMVDPQAKWKLRRVLQAVQVELGLTMIYVTHDQLEALTFAEHVVVMNAGRVLQEGTPEDLFLRPAHRFVGHFIGSPGMNFLPCDSDDAPGRTLLRLSQAGRKENESGAVGRSRSESPSSAGATPIATAVGVRPELLRLTATEGLPARVEQVVHLGRECLVDCRAGTSLLRLRLPPVGLPAVGADVKVAADPEHIIAFDGEGRAVVVSGNAS